METQQSNVYITSVRELIAWPVWPNKVSYEDALRGNEAIEVLNNTDYICISREVYSETETGELDKKIDSNYYCTDRKSGKDVIIDAMSWSEINQYTKLIQALESLSGRTGLIIIVM